jgi:hypothetical protein
VSTAVELVLVATSGNVEELPAMLEATEAEGGVDAIHQVCVDLAMAARQLMGMTAFGTVRLQAVNPVTDEMLDVDPSRDPVLVSMLRFVVVNLNGDTVTGRALFDAVPDEHKPDFVMRLLALVVRTVHMRLGAL